MDMPRITGQLLRNYINKKIILLGTIDRKSSSGRSVKFKTLDGVQVNINLTEPIDGNEEGYAEVQGIIKSMYMIDCARINCMMVDDDFDPEVYTEMVNLYHVSGEMFFEEC